MSLKNKKILVTGGTGFIGRHLVSSLLTEGAKVFCLTRSRRISGNKNLEYITCDLKKIDQRKARDLFRKTGRFDFILYLAASILPPLAKESMLEAKENTLDVFVNFLNIFGDQSDRIIFTSTVDVYGKPLPVNFSEDLPPRPMTPYAIAKLGCEKYLEYYCRVKDKSYSILRFSQVYGPDEPLVRVIPIVVDSLARRREFTLQGRGGDKRRFLYVEDAVRGIKLAMQYLKNDVLNIAGKGDTSILDVIKTAEKLSQRKLKLRMVDPRKPAVNILPSFSKAKSQLGFSPAYSFQTGMRTILSSKGLLYEK